MSCDRREGDAQALEGLARRMRYFRESGFWPVELQTMCDLGLASLTDSRAEQAVLKRAEDVRRSLPEAQR